MYIPTIFWFNRNTALSLPLVAMKHSEAQINLTLNNLENLICFEDYEYEFNEMIKYELPFKDHINDGHQVESIYTTNDNITKDDISKISYLKNERIYIYYFKYITKELIKLKFKNLSSSQIDLLFTTYSKDGTTIKLEDWINFRI